MNTFLSDPYKTLSDYPAGGHYYQTTGKEAYTVFAASPEEARVKMRSGAARGVRSGSYYGSLLTNKHYELVKYCEVPQVIYTL